MDASAIQQARNTFNSMVNMKINRAPLPLSSKRIFPVATLPSGQMLLSDGQTKAPAHMGRIEEMKNQVVNQSLDPEKLKQFVQGLPLRIALPTQQLGEGADKIFAFANYLSQILRPSSPPPAQLASQTFLPEMTADLQGATPSAIANLPPLAPDAKSAFEEATDFYSKFFKNEAGIQGALAKDFLAQYARKEEDRGPGLRGFSLPLVSKYVDAYQLPTAQNADYAQVGNNVFNLTGRI